MMNENKSVLRTKPWTRKVLLILLILIVLLSLIRVSLPFAIKFGAINFLESQGIEANIDDVEISLLDGTFAINKLSGKNKTGKGFSLGRFAIAWQWKPLFSHQAIVDQIEIGSLNVDTMLFENGEMNIAGLEIKSADASTQQDKAEDKQAGTPWDAIVRNIIITDVEVCAQQFTDADKPKMDYCAKLAALKWSGDAGYKPSIQASTSDISPVYVQGSLNFEGIALLNNQLALHLLEIAAIDVDNIDIKTPESISIDQVSIKEFAALQRDTKTSGSDAQMVAFEQLNINPLTLSEFNDLKMGVIEFIGTSANFLIKKDGSTEFSQWLPKKQAIAKQKTETEPFHFSFDEFIFTSNQHFIFTDESLSETFTADVHGINLKLTGLDSNAPEQSSHLVLALFIGKHGSFNLDADISPLSDRPSVNGKGDIAGLDLRMVAPMTRQHIGHNVKSGQLDADLKLKVDKGIIDSNMELALHQFELETLSTKEAEEIDSEFGFPLNSSLSLLRDSDNTIRLDIPVSGDIDNPEFNPRDAIVKASSSAITAAVIHYYTPFGLVFAAESLFDLATALSFEPVLFEAGETVLNAAHKEKLDKLTALMLERPGIHLTLCGISNNFDKDKLFPAPIAAVSPAQQELKSEKTVLKLNLLALKQIAESRSANIKDYLVGKKQVKASRLIECSPEYTEDGIAGVEISI